jgi:hypothetical protein
MQPAALRKITAADDVVNEVREQITSMVSDFLGRFGG